MAEIDKKLLSHLFGLVRIEENKDEEVKSKLLGDLSKILDHFSELQEVDTSQTEPLSGGTFLSNIFREDGKAAKDNRQKEEEKNLSLEQFSKKENRHLKIPPVFE